MTSRKGGVTLVALLEYALARQAAAVLLPPRRKDAPKGMRGVHYTNRAQKRARGQRGHSHGVGAFAPSITTRGR